MSVFSGKVRVSMIRSRNPIGIGGCIFSGFHVDEEGSIVDSKKLIVVHADTGALPTVDSVEVGETWEVTGESSLEITNHKGYVQHVVNVSSKEMTKIRETGDLIVYALSHNPSFKGIGTVYARKLWNHFGNSLYAILDNGDTESLELVLGASTAKNLVEAWKEHVSGQSISFLQSVRIPHRIAQRFATFFGAETEQALNEDPYRLLSFSGSWELVDSIARNRFHLPVDDPRRLRAAIEECLYRYLDQESHTAVSSGLIRIRLANLLKVVGSPNDTAELVALALSCKEGNGAYLKNDEGLYWSVGAYVMEDTVAERIASMIYEPDSHASIFMSTITDDTINAKISDFEAEEQKRLGTPFTLSEEQRQAVILCVKERFSIITGGAGTGKTTVLKCLYFVLRSLEYSICQMALSGRAAKRMHDATGVKSYTIAGYIKNAEKVISELGSWCYVVIDEASMLDLATTFRLLRTMPDHIRMIMVGDPYQLPPIMAGLIFHILAATPHIPLVELKVVKRQDGSTGIPAVAHAIRYGAPPELPLPGKGGVAFLPCADGEILEETIRLFAESPDTTQIIGATRGSKIGGTHMLNRACCDRYTSDRRDLLILNSSSLTYSESGFREGDRIMFVKNDWGRGVNNGSIGHIKEIYDEDIPVDGKDEPAIASAIIEGTLVHIFQSDIDPAKPTIEHGYAVTVHKAQGSQWKRIIVPVYQSRLLDRTLVYTAITRAEEEVIMVGNVSIFRDAVERAPAAHGRSVGFQYLMPQKIAKFMPLAVPCK